MGRPATAGRETGTGHLYFLQKKKEKKDSHTEHRMPQWWVRDDVGVLPADLT